MINVQHLISRLRDERAPAYEVLIITPEGTYVIEDVVKAEGKVYIRCVETADKKAG